MEVSLDLSSIRSENGALTYQLLNNFSKGSSLSTRKVFCDKEEYVKVEEQYFKERDLKEPYTPSFTDPYAGRTLPFGVGSVSAEIADKLVCASGLKLAGEREQRMKDYEKRLETLQSALKCEEGRSFSNSLPAIDRINFDFDGCASERTFQSIERSKDPQRIFLSGVRYEAEGERSRAKSLYLTIMTRFGSSSIAIKAAERLASLTDVQAIVTCPPPAVPV